MALRRSKTYRLAKKKAWKWFSYYIRLRDCVNQCHIPTSACFGFCFTCGNVTFFNEAHAGHFISGRGNAVLFTEKGSHLQCASCNVGRDGEQPKYTLKMIERYGKEVTEQEMALRYKIVKFTQDDLEEIAQKYHDKYEALKGGRLKNGQ